MTTLGLFRRWARQASRVERSTTAAIGVTLLLLVGAALVPASDSDRRAAVRTGTAPTTNADAPSVTSATAPGGAPATSVVLNAPGVRGRGESRRPGLETPLRVRETATGTIKLGFTVIDEASARNFGFEPGLRGDASEAIDAFVDFVNQQGGVLGRRIETVKVRTDFVNGSKQRQKCIELTEGHGVFAVIDSIALAQAAVCVSSEHGTLLINGAAMSAADFERSAPYHVTLGKDDNRLMKDLAYTAKNAGFFDPGRGFRKLGVLTVGAPCDQSVYDGPNGLFAHLRAVDVTEWVEFAMPCQPASAGTFARQAAVTFEDADVTHVLTAVGPPFMKEYTDAAAEQEYAVKYFTSDYGSIIMGGLVDQYNKDAFDGALGVTQTHVGEGPVGKPLPPRAAKCSQILTEHGLPPVSAAPPEDINEDFEVLQLCENLMLFVEAAERAGTNLTRDSWLDALAAVGEFRGATVDLARFARGKRQGGDTHKLVQWKSDCRCWKQITEFEPAVP